MALSPQDWQRAADVYAGRIPPVTGMDVQPMPQPPGAMMQQPEVLMPDSMQGMDSPALAPMPMQAPPLSYDGLAQQVDQSAAEQMGSVQRQAGIRAQGSANQANIQAQQAAVAAQRARNAEQQRRDYAAHVADLEQRGAQLDNEIANSRYEDKRTTGQRVGALIGLAFAGIGDAFSGFAGRQTDYVGQTQQLIDSMVEADKQRWRDQLQNKKDARAANQNALARARQFFQDDRAADEYVGALQKEYWAGQLEAEASRMGNQLVQEQATTAAAKIKQDAAETKLKIMSEAADNTFRDKQLALQRARMGGGGSGPKAQAARLANMPLAELEQKERDGTLTVAEAAALKKIRGSGGSDGLTPYQQLQADKMQRDRLDRVGDDLKNITNARTAIRELSPYMADGADLPNSVTGVIGKLTPNYFASNEGKKFKGYINSFQDAFLRVASGAGVSEAEARRKWEEFGMQPDLNQSEDSIRQGLRMAEKQVHQWEAAIRAKDPEGFDTYEQNRRDSLARNGGGAPIQQPQVTPQQAAQLKTQFNFKPAGR